MGKDPVMHRAITLSLTILLSTTALASAHATWIAQRSGDWAVVHGEGSATDEAYDPSKVGAAFALDAAGNAVAVEVAPQQKSAILKPAGGASVLGAVFDEGWWTEDSAGEWHNAAPDAFPDFRSTGKYQTYIVSYIGLTTTQRPVGHRLEIVPLADPGKLAMGGKLPVQVLLDGKPLEGVVVTNDVLTDWDDNSGLTDPDGKTVLTVANNGLNVAQVYHEVAIGDKAIEGHQAVLSFTSGLAAKD
jgi:nickel transport protein